MLPDGPSIVAAVREHHARWKSQGLSAEATPGDPRWPARKPHQARPTRRPDPIARYECNGFRFPDRDYYDRHVVFDHVVALDTATQRDWFEAFARTLRDVLSQRWIQTAETYDRKNPKHVYYLSMEFLIGRSLGDQHRQPRAGRFRPG